MTYPIRFFRSGGSKLAGFFAYLLAAPLVIFFAGLIPGVLISKLAEMLGLQEPWSALLAWTIALPIFVWGIAWTIRDFRRRATTEVAVFEDRLEIGTTRDRVTIRFSEIQKIRFRPKMTEFSIAFITESGRESKIPNDVAPFQALFPAIQPGLFSRIQVSTEQRILGGETIWVRESRPVAYLRIVRGILLLIGSPLLELRGIPAATVAQRMIRHGWYGRRGGFGISKRGVCEAKYYGGATVAWQVPAIELCELEGILLRSSNGETYSASPYAKDFLAAVVSLQKKRAKPK